MSEIVIIVFDKQSKADEVLADLKKMEKKHLLDWLSTIVVAKSEAGEVKLDIPQDYSGLSGAEGSKSRLAAGLFLAGPLWGSMTVSASQYVKEQWQKYGVDRNFIDEVSDTLSPDSSALFFIASHVQVDQFLAELKGVGGKVLRTSLSAEMEARLQEALEGGATE